MGPKMVPGAPPPAPVTAANVQSTRDPTRPAKAIDDILKLKSYPRYFNFRKAWGILGYSMQQRPDCPNMLNQVNALWLALGQIKTRRSRRARAAIIDALRTLGYHSPLWKASSEEIDTAHLPTQLVGWPPPQPRNWGTNDATRYLNQTAPFSLEYEHWASRKVEKRVWEYYHRYQGFCIRDTSVGAAPGAKIYLRAIPVPKDADSLWKSVGYHVLRRQISNTNLDHGPDVTRPWAVKMLIWTWFMQVLKDGTHPRWCEYQLLQRESIIDDPEFGNLSLARSLHASMKQGLPAYPHEYMLFVIADFFGMQVVVFRAPERSPPDHKKERIKVYRRQDGTNYTFGVYGEPSVGNKRQILLVTDRLGRHYDPVDFDYGPLHEKKGWSAARDGQMSPGPPGAGAGPRRIPVEAGAGDFCAHRGPCTWWPGVNHRAVAAPGTPYHNWNARNLKLHWPALNTHPAIECPHDLARYAYFSPSDRAQMANGANAVPPIYNLNGPHRAYDGKLRTLYGRIPINFTQLAGNLRFIPIIPDDRKFKCFRTGIDIPGDGFVVPADAVINSWTTNRGANGIANPPGAAPPNDPAYNPGPAVPAFEWRFGHRPTNVNIKDGFMLLDDPYLEFEDDKDMVEDD
ncbi:hypothetical protein QBC38DRAFT_409336 [Podospora fimiseda]|uniref:Uncharacterized protein n=1 Tax=Podospora fimiseda TaxID=252190 RepID=A0AAN7H313_9PEZI|nr:hypothetical protein QBC38DRAFT_409336 [Podospora fimiseda]